MRQQRDGLVVGVALPMVAVTFGYCIPWLFAVFRYAFGMVGDILGHCLAAARGAGKPLAQPGHTSLTVLRASWFDH